VDLLEKIYKFVNFILKENKIIVHMEMHNFFIYFVFPVKQLIINYHIYSVIFIGLNIIIFC